VHINTYIWCAVGAGIAWFVGSLMNKDTKIFLIEDIAVGIFGAFIGGEFLAAMFHATGGGPAPFGTALGLAAGAAGVMLALLALLRRAMGPLRAGKSRSKS
jgi:uncharacterized membrane protein YeaQ/YmgE (transglycosylase-associated protein family)